MGSPLSAYLPDDFDPKRPLALIAGQGDYPRLLAQAIRTAGVPLRLVAFHDETPDDLLESVPADERVLLKVGQIGKMLSALSRFEAAGAIMAGQITPRRLFHGLQPDLKATRILLSLKERNAETIFGAIAREIETIGVRLHDARALLDAHLATEGVMTSGRFPIAREDLEHGVRIARECARLDIGQGCVVRRGTVLAVEAFEGTDAMLRRAGEFKTDDALFVKTVKGRQDFRFDVPCFGTGSVHTLKEAGIRSVALAAGGVLLLDRPAVLREAEAAGLSILGFA